MENSFLLPVRKNKPGIAISLLLQAIALQPLGSLAFQDPVPVRLAIEDFLRDQTRGLPGRVSFTVGGLDANNQLAACPSFDIALPKGARLWGRSTLAVRCQSGASWTQYVTVQIRVEGDYLVASRPLAGGQVIAESDLGRQQGDLTDLPPGILIDPSQAVGRSVAMPIAAGMPIRADLLRQTQVVQAGQPIKVVSRGPGFQVSNDGQALNGAAEGQPVRVRLSSGQVVSGIARAGGIAEVGY